MTNIDWWVFLMAANQRRIANFYVVPHICFSHSAFRTAGPIFGSPTRVNYSQHPRNATLPNATLVNILSNCNQSREPKLGLHIKYAP